MLLMEIFNRMVLWVRGKHPGVFLFSKKEFIFLVLPVVFSSTFSLSLKEDQLQKEVNRRREVKQEMLNSPRPRLRRAQMVLFIFIYHFKLSFWRLNGFNSKGYHSGPSFLFAFTKREWTTYGHAITLQLNWPKKKKKEEIFFDNKIREWVHKSSHLSLELSSVGV